MKKALTDLDSRFYNVRSIKIGYVAKDVADMIVLMKGMSND